jgi:hypothetical protein
MDGENLPSGWRKVRSTQHNRYYYVNSETGEKQWTAPICDDSESCWEEKFSAKHDRAYWVNKVTKQSTWINPTIEDVPTITISNAEDAQDQSSIFKDSNNGLECHSRHDRDTDVAPRVVGENDHVNVVKVCAPAAVEEEESVFRASEGMDMIQQEPNKRKKKKKKISALGTKSTIQIHYPGSEVESSRVDCSVVGNASCREDISVGDEPDKTTKGQDDAYTGVVSLCRGVNVHSQDTEGKTFYPEDRSNTRNLVQTPNRQHDSEPTDSGAAIESAKSAPRSLLQELQQEVAPSEGGGSNSGCIENGPNTSHAVISQNEESGVQCVESDEYYVRQHEVPLNDLDESVTTHPGDERDVAAGSGGMHCGVNGVSQRDLQEIEEGSPLTSLRLLLTTPIATTTASLALPKHVQDASWPSMICSEGKRYDHHSTSSLKPRDSPIATPIPTPPRKEQRILSGIGGAMEHNEVGNSCIDDSVLGLDGDNTIDAGEKCQHCGLEQKRGDDLREAYTALEKKLHVTIATSNRQLKAKDSEIESLRQAIDMARETTCLAEAERDAAVACKVKLEAVSVKQMDRIGLLQAKLKRAEHNDVASPAEKTRSPRLEEEEADVAMLTPKQNRWSEMYRDKISVLEVALNVAKFRDSEQSKAYNKLLDKYTRLKAKAKALKRERDGDDRDMTVMAERIVELEKSHENMEAFIAHIVENSEKLDVIAT